MSPDTREGGGRAVEDLHRLGRLAACEEPQRWAHEDGALVRRVLVEGPATCDS